MRGILPCRLSDLAVPAVVADLAEGSHDRGQSRALRDADPLLVLV